MIETKNLTKKFGQNTALNNLNFKISDGEIFCFLGANGAGKTTTINLLLGFLEPTTGEALINGLNVQSNLEMTRSSVAYIPEQVSLYPELTGYENLEFFVKLAGKTHGSDFLVTCLNDAGLAVEFHDKASSTYSKGMRQKVGIAIAMAKQAKVLLLDEPLSGLDPKAANEFCQILIRLKDNGVAILMATHDLFRAKEIGDRLGIMKDGELLETLHTKDVSLREIEETYLKHMQTYQEVN
ncbi:MAG: ABC transporter ATP-binding protein [Woeseiaceae bacterium]|nr:ABC transporter ATP-binding protein [Woeseiaceae bacterium]|tara:strand:- start:1549 stop:2265 length:717 start_codon:yes stop_codon:yes gene_type:complete